MAGDPPPDPSARTLERDDAISVMSAYGAFRVLLVLLAAWTFFAGFSLLTQGVGALTFGGDDAATERVIGAYMLVLVPVYALLAWRRDEFRLLIWVPYAAQLAVVIPTLFDVIFSRDRDFSDAALMLIVSLIFLVLLVYFWLSSHPLDFFGVGDADEEAPDDPAYEDGDEPAPPGERGPSRPPGASF